MLAKFRQLIEAVIELPNAALACVEMAREAEYFRGQREIGNSPQATEERKTWNEIVGKQNNRIHDLTDKLAESERKLAREVESRRVRRFRMSDNDKEPNFGELPPEFRKVMYRISDASFTSKGAWCIGAVDSISCFEWRYLSPEDMP